MLRIDAIGITDRVLAKIESMHSVSFEEAEEAVRSQRHRHVRRGKEGAYEFWGRTSTGRYVLVVLYPQDVNGEWMIGTAREMTDSERASYWRAKGLR